MIQRPLYPEGPQICHAVILHPPSGIAGGDILDIDVHVASGARAVVSTPGATRWYKSDGRQARQTVRLQIASGGRLDWLPLENIFFEQAQAQANTRIQLQSGATAIGWDFFQLGRINQPNYWNEGAVGLHTTLEVDDQLVWTDQGQIEAQDIVRNSLSGMSGFPAHAILWGFGPAIDGPQIEALAGLMPWRETLRGGVTAITCKAGQALYLVRGLGMHLEDLRHLMADAWAMLRPLILGTPAHRHRLWAT